VTVAVYCSVVLVTVTVLVVVEITTSSTEVVKTRSNVVVLMVNNSVVDAVLVSRSVAVLTTVEDRFSRVDGISRKRVNLSSSDGRCVLNRSRGNTVSNRLHWVKLPR
jgi:hypothetical protein